MNESLFTFSGNTSQIPFGFASPQIYNEEKSFKPEEDGILPEYHHQMKY